MRRRRLLKLLTTVSLLLWVAACALWVRSYFVADVWIRERERDEAPGVSVEERTGPTSSSGGLTVERARSVRSGDPAAVAELVAALHKRHPSGADNG